MKILAVGGGSGGHVSPVVAVLNELSKQLDDTSLEARFVCDKSFEAEARELMQGVTIPVKVSIIAAGKLRRYEHFKKVDYIKHPSIIAANIIDIAKIFGGFMQSLWLLIRWRPNVIFAKGGYVCLPLGLAAWVLQIPVVVHDSDAKPGLTNRVLARFAKAIATGYPLENYHYMATKSTYTGVPISTAYKPLSVEVRSELKKKNGFSDSEILVVAMGGSLGALTINRAVIAAGSMLIERHVNTLLITGQANFETCKAQTADLGPHFQVRGFIAEGMSELLGAADIVITRASATVLQEVAGLAKPIIAIPARALSDQHKNAAIYQKSEAAIILSDDQLNEGLLGSTLVSLIENQALQTKLAQNLHEFARPRAAIDVAAILRRVGLPGIR